MRFRRIATAASLIWLWLAGAAMAGARVALVIGNGAYVNVANLPNPPKDAAAIGEMLKAGSFDDVTVKTDLGNQEMRAVLRDFSRKVAGADVAVLFYAGHGVEIGGRNYLIPIDAKLEYDGDVEDEAIDLDRVLQQLEPAKKLKLVILDACRNNPFVRMKSLGLRREVGRGLAPVEQQGSDTLIAFAAAPGETAADGAGDHSPFTTALIANLMRPGLDVRLALGGVRDDVVAATHGAQRPFIAGSLGRDTLALGPAFAAPSLAPTPTPPGPDPAKVAELVKACDDIAASSSDNDRPPGVAGVDFAAMDGARAEPACRAAHAAAPNNPRVEFELARALTRSHPEGSAEAGSLYSEAANTGYAVAMTNLGACYHEGKCMPKDLPAAGRWYQKAADAGNAVAMYGLGLCYHNGDCMPKDMSAAGRWFLKGAEADNADAMYNIGMCYYQGDCMPKDVSAAGHWFQKAAEHGQAQGMTALGVCFFQGDCMPKDIAAAGRWSQKGAEAGIPLAMVLSGFCNYRGDCLPKDLSAAGRWYQKGADASFAPAMYALGSCYYNGDCMPKNIAMAKLWYQKAASAGNNDAKSALRKLGW